MKLTLHQIDAFSDKVFSGNPAAVCVLEEWLPDSLMQNIAAENNLAETAFAVAKDDGYEIRWFTPATEVDLCGHATLATSYVLFEHHGVIGDRIQFHSPASGPLTVTRSDDGLLTLDFPTDRLEEVEVPAGIEYALGSKPSKALKGATDFLLVYDSQEVIEGLKPMSNLVAKLDVRGVIATAPGKEVDFVSRFFAPQVGIDEDPVTGSAHTTLTPYWSGVLGKKRMSAKQLSSRGGNLTCELLGDRVRISGRAVPYLVGEIHVHS